MLGVLASDVVEQPQEPFRLSLGEVLAVLNPRRNPLRGGIAADFDGPVLEEDLVRGEVGIRTIIDKFRRVTVLFGRNHNVS
jgi:hypothetical protein